MVEFGPRLTASPNRENYIAWLEQEFEAAGLELGPCDGYTTDRWLAEDVGLTILEGPGAARSRSPRITRAPSRPRRRDSAARWCTAGPPRASPSAAPTSRR